MLALSKDFRKSFQRNAAGALSALTVFSAAAPAAGCGLVDNEWEWGGAKVRLYQLVEKTVPAPLAGGVAGGLMIKLKDALKNPTEKPQLVQFPTKEELGRPVTEGEVVGYALASPKGLGAFNTLTCLEINNNAYIFSIAHDGRVSAFSDPSVSTVAEGSKPACTSAMKYANRNYKKLQAMYAGPIAQGVCVSPGTPVAELPTVPGPQASPN